MEPANVNMNELTNFCPGWMNVSGPMPIVFPANPYIPLEEQQNFYQPYGGIPSAYGNRPDAGRSENPPDQQIQQERSTQTLGDLSTVLLPMNRFYMPYKVSNRQIHLERGVTPRIPSMGSSDGLLRPESSCCRSLLHSFTSADSGIQSGGPMSSAPHTPENISSGSDEQCTGGRRKRNRPEKSSQMNSLLRKMTEMSETGMIPSTICQSNTSDADNTAMLTRSRKRKRPERKPVTPAEMVSHAVVYKNKAYFALPVQLQVKNRGEQEQPVFDFVGKQWDERTYSSRVKKNLLKTKITARSLKTLLENQDLVDKGAADPLAKTATSTTQESNTLEQRLMQGIPVTATSKKSKGKKLARSRLIP